jgi:hypothetical protein
LTFLMQGLGSSGIYRKPLADPETSDGPYPGLAVIELEDSVQWLTNATYPPESEVCDSEGSLVVFGFYLPYYFS